MPEENNVELSPVVLEKEHDTVVLIEAPPTSVSLQADDEDLWTPDQAIAPPLNLEQLSRLSDSSHIRCAAVDSIARNTVGLGYEVVPGPGHAEDVGAEDYSRVRYTLEALAARDHRLEKPTLGELLSAVKVDEESCGNGALEVSRNRNTGQIDGLYHVQGKRLRRLRQRDGWIIGPSSGNTMPEAEQVQFYNFGEKVRYDRDGTPQAKLQRGRRWDRNEILHFRIYSHDSRDYGLPRDIGLVIEYAAARLANEWSAGFFGSSGTPPSLIFVRGVENRDGSRVTFTVPPATVARMEAALRTDAPRAARVALIPVPAGTETDHIQLGQLSERDMTFNEFKKAHRRNVLSSFRLSPIFVADTDDAGRYTAEVQRALTLEQLFDPEQRRYEDRLHATLLRDLGFGKLRVRFKRLAVEADHARREAAERLAEAGAITRGELREAMGWPKLDPKVHGENVNDELVSTGQPRGAENRTTQAADQRGLRPGIGGRSSMAKQNGHGDEMVEEEIEALIEDVRATEPSGVPDDE